MGESEEKKFDEVDVRNAARLLRDYCTSLGTSCRKCTINTEGGVCPLAMVPFAWRLPNDDNRE